MQCDDKKTDMRTFAAEPEDIGTRIDVFAAENSDALSRSGFKKLIEEGNVLVNDKAVKANYKLRKNDIVTLIIPEAELVSYTHLDVYKRQCLHKSGALHRMRTL